MKPAAETVLIIEDNDIAREGLAVILARQGYNAVIASNGRKAFGMIRNGLRPALVLLDMLMPEEDGWAFMTLLIHRRLQNGAGKNRFEVLPVLG
jgi:CheY-like chemotaxis protein